MANWTGGRLTKAGNDLQIKVEAGLCKLELTKIKLGDGTEGVDATDNLTDLVGPKAVFGISSVVAKDGMCTVTGVISSSNVTAAFYAREWGLFAKDPDIGEILYMISLDPNPESIPPKTAALKQAATYAMNIVVSNAANITAHIDPAGLVTIAILEEYLRRVVGKTDGKLTETLDFANDVGTILRGFMAGDDRFRIYAGRKDHNEGYLEIATADDGSESIVVRQYADQEFRTLVREAKLLDEQGNTSFPGRVSAAGFAGTADNAKEAVVALSVTDAVKNHFYRHIGGYETPTITALINWELMETENNGVDARNIRNAESGVIACGGDNTSKSGYGKSCILLKQVYTDFDKILVLGCDDAGSFCTRQVFDKWELDLMFANSLSFNVINDQDNNWRIFGGKKGTYAGELSAGKVWRTHSQNCGIVEIYGIKY